MATPVFNNGILMRDVNYKVTPHLDSYHLTNMLKGTEPMDLGPIDLWMMYQKVEMPLYQMSNFGGKNTIMVESAKGEYKWQIPVVSDHPYITEDVEPRREYLGIDGTDFKIKLNKRAFGHGDIITYDKYNGLQMFITAEDILPSNDGFIYTVQLVNDNNSGYLDKQFLKPGTKVFRIGSARGEYGEKFSDIGEVETGYREFFNFVGTSEAHAHYTVSSRAELMAKGGMKTDGSMMLTEIWRNFDKSIDPSITNLNEMVTKMGKDYIKKAEAKGTLTRSFITKLEATSLTKIATDIESYLMWGRGGKIKQDGPDDIRLSVGLWRQLDNSYKRIYNKAGFHLDIFQSELFNFFNGKVEFQGPDPKREIMVQTGMAGMKLINEQIRRNALGTGMTVNMDQSGTNAISGKNPMDMHFGYAFTSYTIPFLANVKFVLNPALDNVHTSDIENPIIDGYPLSSYSFIVFDITDNTNDNIFLLKNSWNHKLRWFFQNGTMDYLGRESGFQSSSLFNGYKCYMTQAMPAVWVKDPTKVLKIVMRNPMTGGSL